MVVSLQDFFRYYSMKDKTEYSVYYAELETKRDLIKKGEGLRRGKGKRGRAERKNETEGLNQISAFWGLLCPTCVSPCR